MADGTGISWASLDGNPKNGATWNPIVGCSIKSAACTHCYAMGVANRLLDKPGSHYEGTTKRVNGNAVWTGKVALAPEEIMLRPLRWSRPRGIFVNSMGDVFHEDVPDEWVTQAFVVMALANQHTFYILTKRPERMRAWMTAHNRAGEMKAVIRANVLRQPARLGFRKYDGTFDEVLDALPWPLANVWMGVTAEDQDRAVERIPVLLQTPAARRFVSIEPMLGEMDLRRLTVEPGVHLDALGYYGQSSDAGETSLDFPAALGRYPYKSPRLDWVLVGGESGDRKKIRVMRPDWARKIRDQCVEAGVAYFFKQWGEYVTGRADGDVFHVDGKTHGQLGLSEAGVKVAMRAVDGVIFGAVGVGRAGAELDGRTWNQRPPSA
jgi:protein gp37